jgi:hypothetical protein
MVAEGSLVCRLKLLEIEIGTVLSGNLPCKQVGQQCYAFLR